MNNQNSKIKNLGNNLVQIFHYSALFVIGAITVWSAFYATTIMFYQEYATIQDILLLFIYLEIGAMVGIYFKTNHMPVRFLIYIGITALTRHMVDLITIQDHHTTDLLILGSTVLILAFSIVLIRYASFKFPSENKDQEDIDKS